MNLKQLEVKDLTIKINTNANRVTEVVRLLSGDDYLYDISIKEPRLETILREMFEK